MNATAIAKAIGHAIFKHDLNITDDLFIIHANELDTLCEDATREITENQSLTIDHTDKPTGMEIEAAAKQLYEMTHIPEADPGWYAIESRKQNLYRLWMRSALKAARKAVA